MMKKKHKGKKAITAMGAMVTAGLTPGIIAATPACMPGQNPNALITAAEVVAIDGNAYSFDELYDQQPDSVIKNVDLPDVTVTAYQRTTKYGGPFRPVPREPDRMPQFPGGEAALNKYLESHIQYPANAILNKIQGEVIVQLVVRENGEIGTVKVARSVDKDLEEEAVRVVESMPKFIPGSRNGKPLLMIVTLPVLFKLPDENAH
jgi:protein TonB